MVTSHVVSGSPKGRLEDIERVRGRPIAPKRAGVQVPPLKRPDMQA